MFKILTSESGTHKLVSKFPTSEVYEIALSPALIDHSLVDRLIALGFPCENAVRLFNTISSTLV